MAEAQAATPHVNHSPDQAPEQADQAAPGAPFALVLRGREEQPILFGQLLRPLTPALYRAICMMLEAGDAGVSGAAIEAAIGRNGRRVLNRYAVAPQWNQIIAPPGRASNFVGGVFRLIAPVAIQERRLITPADVAHLTGEDQAAIEGIVNRGYKAFDHPRFSDEAGLLHAADCVPAADIADFGAWIANGVWIEYGAPFAHLTPEQESALTLAMQLCRRRVADLRKQVRAGAVDHGRLDQLLRWHKRSLVYRDRLLGHYLRAAVALTIRYRPRHRDDLIAGVVASLIVRIEGHDPNSEFSLAAKLVNIVHSAVGVEFLKQATYRRHHTTMPEGADDFMAAERPLRARDRERHEGYLEELRRILSQNTAGLTPHEMAAVRGRLGPAHGKRELAPVEAVAQQLHRSKHTVLKWFQQALRKIRAVLERAMSRARVLELVAARRRARAAGCPA